MHGFNYISRKYCTCHPFMPNDDQYLGLTGETEGFIFFNINIQWYYRYEIWIIIWYIVIFFIYSYKKYDLIILNWFIYEPQTSICTDRKPFQKIIITFKKIYRFVVTHHHFLDLKTPIQTLLFDVNCFSTPTGFLPVQ